MIPEICNRFLAFLFVACFSFVSPSGIEACHLSYSQVDTVIAVGNDYDVFMTLCIGGGITGIVKGGDGDTRDIAFGIYSSCPSPVNLLSWTPVLTGDTTGESYIGTDVGPQPQAPFYAQTMLYYAPVQYFGNPLICVGSTPVCGNVHQQCFSIRIRLNVIPDSIRVFGVEGGGNPVAGCFPDQDMVMDLSTFGQGGLCCNDNVAPIAVCASVSAYLDASGLATISAADADSGSSDNCRLDQVTISKDTFTCANLGTQTITLLVSDQSGNPDSCQATVQVFDFVAPVIFCPADFTTQSQGPGCGTNVNFALPTGTDNCGGFSITTNNPSGSYFPVGVTTVTYFAFDSSNNMGFCAFDITVLPPTPIASVFNSSQTGNMTYSFTDQSSAGAIFWNWDFGDGNVSSLQSPAHQYAAPGTYTVCLIAADSCSADTSCQALTVLVGMESALQPVDVTLFPNPGDGLFNLGIAGRGQEKLRLRVQDPMGRTLADISENLTGPGGNLVLDLQHLPSGIYFLEVNGEGWKTTKRLLIQ
jgi:hypothetical protein